MRRLFGMVCLAVAAISGMGPAQGGVAHANSAVINVRGNSANGVGPSPGVTGRARACEVQSLNIGDSNANGLTCSDFSVTVGPGEYTGATCTLTFTGSGLMLGSQPTYLLNDVDQVILTDTADIVTVALNGTLNATAQFAGSNTFVFSAETADGGTLTQTVTYDSATC